MDGEIIPTKKGIRPCLKCGKNFKSMDLMRNRVCPSCNKSNERDRSSILQAGDSVYTGTSRVNLSER